jgi:hypothetical protein
MRFLLPLTVLCLVSLTIWKSQPASEAIPAKAVHDAAAHFIETLEPEKKSLAVMEYASERRVQWHFIPMETRKGLPVMNMSEPQRAAAFELLRSAVSQLGYDKSRRIMAFEKVLLELEGPASAGRRNPDKYYFSIFGTPAKTGTWGLSIEGHHLSLNFVIEDGVVVDSTPQVFAANPAELKAAVGDEFPKGLRILRAEEETGFALLAALDESQRTAAVIDPKAPAEVRWASEAQPKPSEPKGIPAGKLNDAQKAMLREIIKAYADSMRDDVAQSRWKLIEEQGFDKVHFAWAGADKPGIGHYYCVQGPTFIIEFVNVQPDAAGNIANHIHCIWRDLQGDFHLPIQ